MKKHLLSIALAATVGLGATNANAQTIRVTLQLPIKHSLGQNLLCFKDGIEKKTDLKVQIFPSAQLYKDKQVPQAVGSGAVEMGTASLTRFAGSVPAVDAVYVPFLLDSAEKVRKATAPGSEFRKAIDSEVLKKTGARILWWQAFGRTIYLSKKDPIRVPTDLEGKKVRTFGKLLGWTAEALGASPTLMSGSKQFLAYQQGAVDVGITGLTGAKSRKLYEVMDSMTLTYDSDIEFVAVINEKFYQSLKPEQREAIQTVGLGCEKQLRDKIENIETDALKFLRTKFKTVIDLTDEERAQWRTATAGVIDRFIKNAGPVGETVIKAAKSY